MRDIASIAVYRPDEAEVRSQRLTSTQLGPASLYLLRGVLPLYHGMILLSHNSCRTWTCWTIVFVTSKLISQERRRGSFLNPVA